MKCFTLKSRILSFLNSFSHALNFFLHGGRELAVEGVFGGQVLLVVGADFADAAFQPHGLGVLFPVALALERRRRSQHHVPAVVVPVRV